MAKSKKKKQKTADFHKVKLKVGKKKPSATNATNIAFKSSSINVLSQLEEKSEPTNRRNLSLKDILSQLSHYNQNTRQDASFSLKEFLIQHPSSLQQNLSQIIAKFLEKSVDSDHVVRKNFSNCLRHIFSNISEQEIYPFFSLVMAHLNCAMTHINEDIQIDGLHFLDICLDCFPHLFMKDSKKVLHSILSLISFNKPEFGGNSNKGKKRDHKGISMIVNKNLSADPTGRISSLKTKRDVLERLLKITSLLFDSNDDRNIEMNNSCTVLKDTPITQLVTYVPVSKYLQCQPDIQDKPNDKLNGRNVVQHESSQEKTKESIMSFLPVLLKCWSELNPATHSSPSGDISTDSSLITMSTIAKIIKLVVSEYPNEQTARNSVISFADEYFDEYVNSFMEQFPYSVVNQPSSATKKSQKNITEDSLHEVTSLNINLCEIYSKLLEYDASKGNSHIVVCKKILDYIKSLITDFDSNGQREYLQVIRKVFWNFCERFLSDDDSQKGTSLKNSICGLLQEFFYLYKCSKSVTFRMHLLSILEHCNSLQESCLPTEFVKVMNRWNDALPSDLQSASCDNLTFTEKLIKLLSNHMIQKKASLQWCDSLVSAISHIMASKDGIMGSESVGLQKKLIDLVYHLPRVPKEIAENFDLISHRKKVSESVRQKLVHVLFYCCKDKKTLELSLFLSFSFSAILGISIPGLKKLDKSYGVLARPERPCCVKYLIYEDIVDEKAQAKLYSAKVKSVQLILDILQTLDCKDHLSYILNPPLTSILGKFDVFPSTTFLGILNLVERLHHWQNALAKKDVEKKKDEDFNRRISFLIFSTITSSFHEWFRVSETPGKAFYNSCLEIIWKILNDNEIVLEYLLEYMNLVKSKSYLENDVITGGMALLCINQSLQRKIKDLIMKGGFSELHALIKTMSSSYYLYEKYIS